LSKFGVLKAKAKSFNDDKYQFHTDNCIGNHCDIIFQLLSYSLFHSHSGGNIFHEENVLYLVLISQTKFSQYSVLSSIDHELFLKFTLYKALSIQLFAK
jgi:hypothetical protein